MFSSWKKKTNIQVLQKFQEVLNNLGLATIIIIWQVTSFFKNLLLSLYIQLKQHIGSALFLTFSLIATCVLHSKIFQITQKVNMENAFFLNTKVEKVSVVVIVFVVRFCFLWISKQKRWVGIIINKKRKSKNILKEF